jgi:hypothetical protein
LEVRWDNKLAEFPLNWCLKRSLDEKEHTSVFDEWEGLGDLKHNRVVDLEKEFDWTK